MRKLSLYKYKLFWQHKILIERRIMEKTMLGKLFFLNSIAIRDNLSELLCYLTYRDFLQLQFCSGALNLLIQLQFKHSFFLISLFTKLSLEILIVTHLFYVYWLNFVTKFFNSPLLTFWVCFQYCNQWVLIHI